jgi:hypothetical protein
VKDLGITETEFCFSTMPGDEGKNIKLTKGVLDKYIDRDLIFHLLYTYKMGKYLREGKFFR